MTDFRSNSRTEDEDEDISHEAYVRRHMIAEKAEKLRYYQSAIANSRKRKKQREFETTFLTYICVNLIFKQIIL